MVGVEDPDPARSAAERLAELTGVLVTAPSSCSARAGHRPPRPSASRVATLPMTELPGLRGPGGRGPSRHRRVVRRGRACRPSCCSAGPISTRVSASAPWSTASGPPRPRGARRRCSPTPTGRCVPTGRSAASSSARPPEPDRDLAAGRPALRRPHRLLVAAAAGRGSRPDPSLAEAVYAWLPDRTTRRTPRRSGYDVAVRTCSGCRRSRKRSRRENAGSRWSGSRR